MQQLSAPLLEKLDELLAQLCNGGGGIAPSERVPVLVKCQRGSVEEVVALVHELGGKMRHPLKIVDAVAAWVPLSQIERLALKEIVAFIELEQSFTTA